MNKVYRVMYCALLATIVTVPLVFTAINFCAGRLWQQIIFNEPDLVGVINTPEKPTVSLESIYSGQFQSSFESYFEF